MYKLVANEALTFRSVLRTQMKVQTEGLLLDFNTTNPPGPFSPLRKKERESLVYSLNMFCILIGWGCDRPDVAIMRGFADVVGRHSCRNVAVSPALHPTNIHKVPEGQKRERDCEFSITSLNYHITTYRKYIRSKRKLYIALWILQPINMESNINIHCFHVKQA